MFTTHGGVRKCSWPMLTLSFFLPLSLLQLLFTTQKTEFLWTLIFRSFRFIGGLPGCSVEHYLVLMLDFIKKNLDKNQTEPTAVLAGLVDFSKAFNRIDHNVIVTILSDLSIPTCALRLIISYLSCRKMCVRYNGAVSTEQDIPGGGPQGGLLTVLLFDLQVNQAGEACTLPHFTLRRRRT